MSISVIFNGQTYELPSVGMVDWGTALNDYLVALSSPSLSHTNC